MQGVGIILSALQKGSKTMAIKQNPAQEVTADDSAATAVGSDPHAVAKRKSEAVRRFVDKNVVVATEITPKWRRAVDNYNRLKNARITR